jgi:hypothetical protein
MPEFNNEDTRWETPGDHVPQYEEKPVPVSPTPEQLTAAWTRARLLGRFIRQQAADPAAEARILEGFAQFHENMGIYRPDLKEQPE